MTEVSEFERFTSSLPKAMELALADGGTGTPTAFYTARRAGWEVDEIIHDTLSAVRRGGGPGVVVNRLKTLGANARTESVRKALRADGYLPTPVPPEFIPTTVETDPEHFRQRVDLLHQIKRDGSTPDEAEQMMTELLDSQRGVLL